MNEEDIKLSEWNRQTIGFAIRDLGEAFSAGSRDDDFTRCVKKAKRNINVFLNEIYPTPELTNREASLARCLQTYSRKYMDSKFSCFIWQALEQGFGVVTWHSFIKACVGNKSNVERAFNIAEKTHQEIGGFESLAMISILEQWIEKHDMQGAVNEIIKDGGIEE
jgi:hypothetical protein